MTAVIVSTILIIAVASSIAVFNWLQTRDRLRKDKKLIRLFNQTGERGGLAFSSQEIICNKIIGLDGLNRKFVVVSENGNCQIINLNDVRSCSVEKKLLSGSSAISGNEMRVAYIQLYFHLQDKRYESVVFYDYLLQRGTQQQALENKANDWKIILSKLIPSKRRESA